MVTVTKRAPNGLAEPMATPGQPSKLERPRIERWFDVPEYPRYQVRLWVNYPRRLKTTIQEAVQQISGLMDEARGVEGESASDALVARAEELKAEIQGCMSAIVLEHNGWPDEDDNILPQPPDPAFWDQLDQHLSNVVSRLAIDAPGLLPNSTSAARRQ